MARKKQQPKKTAPKQEEREALSKVKRAEKARKARQRQVEREQRSKLGTAIRETKKTYPACRCELRADMKRDDLIALGSGCHSNFVCPRLNAVRRAVGI